MATALSTTTELLDGLRDPGNQTAWCALDERMRPVVIAVARRLGLPADAAEEVAQHTLVEVFEGYRRGTYDRSRGRLRGWIICIARHRAIDELRRRDRRGGHDLLADIPDPQRTSAIWEVVWRAHLARESMRVLRAT
ncbi:MAG: sigma factor, partial [Planctomycetota bacterium]